jgi:hypothetical protein
MPTPLARDSDRLFGPQFHMDYVGTSGPDCTVMTYTRRRQRL